MADELRDWIAAQHPGDGSQSPMEQLFYSSLKMMWGKFQLPTVGVQLTQQGTIGRYRADFLFVISAKDGKKKRLVVEIDGHDYHERTKEQAAHDKARDRWMVGDGCEVMRFTGSEVWRNPFQCARECADRIHQIMFGMTPREARAQAGLLAIRAIIGDD